MAAMAKQRALERAYLPRVVSSDYLCGPSSDAAKACPAAPAADSLLSRATSCCTELSDCGVAAAYGASDCELDDDSSACPPAPKRHCLASRPPLIYRAGSTASSSLSAGVHAALQTPSRGDPPSLPSCPDAPQKQRRGAVLRAGQLRKLMRPLDFSAL